MAPADIRIGVDLGGTKIEAAVLDRGGRILARRRIRHPGGRLCRRSWRRSAGWCWTWRRELGATGSVGVGIPGAISPATGLIKNANSTCLIGHALDRDLAAALGRPVRLANDADCFALSEATDGAAAGAPIVFGAILGTGVGGGVVVQRPAPRGPQRHRRRMGPFAPALAARRGAARRTLLLRQARLHRDLPLRPGTGPRPPAKPPARSLGAAEVAARAEAGDGVAEATMRRYEDRLARALATVINLLDPHVDRARRRARPDHPALPHRAAPLGRVRVFRRRWRRGWCRRAMAIPAACAAPPGSGGRTRRR